MTVRMRQEERAGRQSTGRTVDGSSSVLTIVFAVASVVTSVPLPLVGGVLALIGAVLAYRHWDGSVQVRLCVAAYTLALVTSFVIYSLTARLLPPLGI